MNKIHSEVSHNADWDPGESQPIENKKKDSPIEKKTAQITASILQKSEEFQEVNPSVLLQHQFTENGKQAPQAEQQIFQPLAKEKSISANENDKNSITPPVNPKLENPPNAPRIDNIVQDDDNEESEDFNFDSDIDDAIDNEKVSENIFQAGTVEVETGTEKTTVSKVQALAAKLEIVSGTANLDKSREKTIESEHQESLAQSKASQAENKMQTSEVASEQSTQKENVGTRYTAEAGLKYPGISKIVDAKIKAFEKLGVIFAEGFKFEDHHMHELEGLKSAEELEQSMERFFLGHRDAGNLLELNAEKKLVPISDEKFRQLVSEFKQGFVNYYQTTGRFDSQPEKSEKDTEKKNIPEEEPLKQPSKVRQMLHSTKSSKHIQFVRNAPNMLRISNRIINAAIISGFRKEEIKKEKEKESRIMHQKYLEKDVLKFELKKENVKAEYIKIGIKTIEVSKKFLVNSNSQTFAA